MLAVSESAVLEASEAGGVSGGGLVEDPRVLLMAICMKWAAMAISGLWVTVVEMGVAVAEVVSDTTLFVTGVLVTGVLVTGVLVTGVLVTGVLDMAASVVGGGAAAAAATWSLVTQVPLAPLLGSVALALAAEVVDARKVAEACSMAVLRSRGKVLSRACTRVAIMPASWLVSLGYWVT